ncbi:apolipoprotein N-acyltransferase [Nocardioides dubius]|uniref:Apolipoprotein N-acyltransferase n=1 Tax=Nocardioides dubius TaxID=317019 RepID=A0ABN1TLB6_9ACTN
MRTRYALAPVLGFALSLAFEPAALFWIMIPALAGFFALLRGRSVRQGALLGLLFGGCFIFANIYWMRAVADAAWIGLAGVQALYLTGAGAALAVVSRWRLWPLWMGLVWVGIEVARGSFPWSGFTWGRLSFAVVDTPYAALLPWIGSNGVSLLLATGCALLVWCVESRARVRPVGLTLAALAVATLVPSLVGPQWGNGSTARVAVVQGDVPGDGTDVAAYHRTVTADHVALTKQLGAEIAAGSVARPDFVVWPENSTAIDPFVDEETRTGIERAVTALGTPLLVGAMVDHADDDKVLNQGVVFDPVTGDGDRYTKRHPVPFGEYIPLRSWIPEGTNIGRLAEIPRDMVAGTNKDPLRIGELDVVDAICFDVSYDDVFVDQVRRGGELVVVQTSNAMFIHTSQIDQQFAISRLRALETGRAVVVAAINGRSGVIGPDGEVIADIAPRTAGVIQAEVQLASGTPLGLYVGPWLGRLSVLVLVAAVAVGMLSYRRQRQNREEGLELDRR